MKFSIKDSSVNVTKSDVSKTEYVISFLFLSSSNLFIIIFPYSDIFNRAYYEIGKYIGQKNDTFRAYQK